MKLNFINFNKYLNKKYTFENKPKVAVAISGGPDSMALIFLVNKYIKKIKGNTIALVIDHNLRKNSSYESRWTQDILKKNKINCKILRVNNSQIKKKNMNEARVNRYKLITYFCKKNHIMHLFVGHHKDDNIETFLFRKIAGSDFEGLQSIKEISLIDSVNLIRPLLNFSKKSIYEFNKKNKIPFIEDPTNINLNFTRPVIRNFLKKQNLFFLDKIEKEFSLIIKKLPLYKFMINKILIKNIVELNSKFIKLNYYEFISNDDLIIEKLIKNIYTYLTHENAKLRSKKIEILINLLKVKDFNKFILKKIAIYKIDDFLVLSQKTHQN